MSVTLERDSEQSHVAHLRVDTGQLNLLSPEAIAEIRHRAQSVPSDVSVLTIRGISDEEQDATGLTAGLQLDSVKEYSVTEARELITSLYETIETIRDINAVTVCACGEFALGAGLELAMACDFRIATTDATLGLPEIDIGLVTGIHGGLLIRLVGVQRAKELIYLGEPVSGTRAVEIGLINTAVVADEYETALDTLITRLTSKSPLILRWQKDVFRAWRSVGVDSGINSSRETIAACFDTHDQLEAMTAFLEGYNPDFKAQ